MESILLATDGSTYARQAAREAIDLAAAHNASLYVICVVDRRRFNEPGLSSTELATIYAEDHAAMCVKDVVEMAKETPISVQGVARHGIPHQLILDYADEVDADVIVIGEHGDHDKHLSGVGRKIRSLSNRDVYIVKREATKV